MDNYNSAHNLHNSHYYENQMDYSTEQKNSINYQQHERQMSLNKNGDSGNYDMNTFTKAPDDFDSNNVHSDTDRYNFDQHRHGYEEHNYGPSRVPAKPLYNYLNVKDEQYHNSSPLENGHNSHMASFDDNQNIQDYQMQGSHFNQPIEYHTEDIVNNHKLNHASTRESAHESTTHGSATHEHKNDYTYEQEAFEPNISMYNKKKSTFNADLSNHPLGASCIKQNNIYGYGEKKTSLVYESDYNKQRDNAYQQHERQLHLSKNEASTHDQYNYSDQNEYLKNRHFSKQNGDETNHMHHSPLSNEHRYMNNMSNEYFQDDASVTSSTIRNAREDAELFREKNISHTKIFDYVGPNKYDDDNDKVGHKKKLVDTFVPRYKNLSARETLLKHLAGNDNITVLAANSMDYNSEKSIDKEGKTLPNVYPFNVSENVKTVENDEQRRRCTPKLLAANCNYVNNYTNNGQDISLSQIRHNNISSHIFDTDDMYEKNGNLLASAKEATCVSMLNKRNEQKAANDQEVTIEKQEKRKNNPMYTDLFGRKTPDTYVNTSQQEKMLSATMKNNWMYHASDVKKYTQSVDEQKENISYENLNDYDKEKFNRKSFFVKDGYDNTKRLQEALKKGSNYALQAHLQSSFQSENESTNTPIDVNKVETYYLMLYNLKDSLSDEDIKKIVKESGAHLVSYKPDYDLLSNLRKSTAKLCIRHNKGKQGLEILQQLFSQFQVKAIEK